MTAELDKSGVTPEEYISGEDLAESRHEYLNGLIYAMAGTTIEHNQIALAVALSLRTRLKGSGCVALAMDVKVKIDVDSDVRFYYPDGQVVCGERKGDAVACTNPVIIVEVISESTRRIDEGEKRQGYQKLPSLQLYLLVETKMPRVVADCRAGDTFTRETYAGLDAVIPLPFFHTALPLAEIYEDIVFASLEV